MPFPKGKSGNPKGRPKGAVNKASKEVKEFISDFLTTNRDEFLQRMEGLKDSEYVNAYLTMIEYAVPKLSRQQLTGSEEGEGGLTINIVNAAGDNTES